MDSIDLFYQLKTEILCEYQKAYPFWKGTLQDFGNKEIAQLQDLIEVKTNQRISEKWFYTHIKPLNNTRLPREDMLDILTEWLGYTGWDEFKVRQEELFNSNQKKSGLRGKVIAGILLFIIVVVAVVVFGGGNLWRYSYKVNFRDQYTQKLIDETNFSIFLIDDRDSLNQQKINKGFLELLHDDEKIQVKVISPYYKDEVFLLMPGNDKTIYLQPDDYAMMLLVYMNSNLKDWEKRRKQLNEIILEDAEILEVMNEDIGVEFLNKQEFIDKITIPVESTKRMEIIDIKYQGKGKIIGLKFIQKNK